MVTARLPQEEIDRAVEALRGEVVVVLDVLPRPESVPGIDNEAVELVRRIAQEGLGVKRAAAAVADYVGCSQRLLYDAAVCANQETDTK